MERGDAAPTLAAPRASLVGRVAELAKIRQLLEVPSLVTLTGPPGAGKTRLALEVARRERAHFDGVPPPIDLASLRSQDLVMGAVATAVGVVGRGDVSLLDEVVDLIRDRRQLLLLDNCEHLLEECAFVCESLLSRCPEISVLVTSRTPLRIPGETVLAVPPLGIEDEAPQLFAERARAVNAGFEFGPANRDDVIELCRRLDAIPLAIELAATWAAVMSPSELLPLLESRFTMLAEGVRSAPERHRTLWSAIDWSHELLEIEERTLFRRLSVFAGSFTREAAEAVCSDDALPAPAIVKGLGRLVAASMVAADTPPAGTTRYRLLESLRDYGLERLNDAGEEEDLHARHLAHFTAVAEAAFDRRMSGGPESVIDLLAPDRDNVRAALDWGTERDPERALGLARTLVEDIRRSLFPFAEMRVRLDELLGSVSRDTTRYAWGLIVAGQMALVAVADDEAMQRFTASLHLFEKLGDLRGQAWAHLARGGMRWVVGDLVGASEELRLSESLHAQLGNAFGRYRARCRAAMADAFDPARRPAARRELHEAITEGRELGDTFGVGMAYSALGILEVAAGDLTSARVHLLEAVNWLRDDALVAMAVLGLGLCWAESDPERCLRLIGGSDAIQPRAGGPKPVALARLVEDYWPRAVALLGEDVAARARASGRGMAREEILALAVSEEDQSSELERGTPAGGLTRREEEIAALVADGLTNREIAASLTLSVRTVETHVDRILGKLGFHNRARLASWVREQAPTKDT